MVSTPKNTELYKSVNLGNLIKINTNKVPHNQSDQKTIKVHIKNVQSIRNKDLTLHHYICDSKMDLCVLTETWLIDSVNEKSWISCTSLNNGNLRIDTSNRIGQQGGSLELVYDNILNVAKTDEANNGPFQFAVWKVSYKVYNIIIIGIYHPPYSAVNWCTNAMFLDEFTEWSPGQLVKYKNAMIAGDINFHLNNIDDPDATTLKDTLDA